MKDNIKKLSRALRQSETDTEKKLWSVLRNKRFHGCKFRRQHPIRFELDGLDRCFVADFFCLEQQLVVEIDGLIHDRQVEYDTHRSYIIQRLGLNVIRFSNDEIENNLDVVLQKLAAVLV